MVAEKDPSEIHILREYDAPIDVVWNAWVDPVQAAKWWGPRGFTITTHSKELKPGGIWHYTMHGPDGVDYPNKALYHVVEDQQRLVYDHGGYDDRPPLFRVTVLFSESNGMTVVDMTMKLSNAEDAAAIKEFIKRAGGNSTWDRFAEYLAAVTSDRNQFVINRTFDAPAETLFLMWTDSDHLVNWQPPSGFEMKVSSADICSGGTLIFQMSDGKEIAFHARFEYQEVESPNQISYRQMFTDEAGNIGRHPMMPDFPAVLLTTVVFNPEDDTTTRIKVTSEPIGDVSESELQSFLDSRAGMTIGWSGSFDKLAEVLSVPTF